MNIWELNEKLDKLLNLNELRKEDAGEEILDFKDYDDALQIIKDKYDKGEARAYCPDAVTIDFNNTTYKLAVVLGVAEEQENGMKPHAMAHIFKKHAYSNKNKTEPTEEQLIKAAKNIKSAYSIATKKKNIAFDPFENKIIFSNGHYVYIICLAKNQNEINYIHNLFPEEKANYVKGEKIKIQNHLKNELPPKHQEDF